MLAKHASRNREIFCTSDAPLTEVFHKMMKQNCSCMPVVESPTHKNIIGTITEHDICLKIISGGLNPQRLSAARVMNGEFTTVGAETPLEECAELLQITVTNRLFVVDENGALLGVLTEKDIAAVKPVAEPETVIADLPVQPAFPPNILLAY